ncbi:hypothetical protein RFI_24513 [Reticulomyxa filosa]|uniref:BAR domain-containing protein n=1 Tax=Reticulomyxa filosa TaxID=46433 RepID=X6MFU1_RETFI|nr:hypothetical protein RFI_24513 [Reticulomyxa filosa]|eukprot:ETO12863.1 hypothetical protein RFI_24513 [Reticulomyxa filosa]
MFFDPLNLFHLFVCANGLCESSRKKGADDRNDGDPSRRQSRVLIVKSKIANEIQRKPRKAISYTEVAISFFFFKKKKKKKRNPSRTRDFFCVCLFEKDSPFWWKQMIDCERRIKRLAKRLNHMCDLTLDFCGVCNQFSDHCANIYNAVKKSWEDVENEYAMDILSLNAQMNELGEQFAHMSAASRQLAVTAVLVKPFREFSQHHLAEVNASSKALKSLNSQHELTLKQLLLTPQHPPDPATTKKTFYVMFYFYFY